MTDTKYMNLNEAFGMLNNMKSLFREIESILLSRDVTVKTKQRTMRSAVEQGVKDEITVIPPYRDAVAVYVGHATELVAFYLFLLEEKQKLLQAIREAKTKQSFDFEGQRSLNADRQQLQGILRSMVDIQSSSVIKPKGGEGFRFNANGDQVKYVCPLKEITSINFDRNFVRNALDRITKDSSEVSRTIEQVTANALVNYTPVINLDNGIKAAFDEYLRLNGGAGLYTDSNEDSGEDSDE